MTSGTPNRPAVVAAPSYTVFDQTAMLVRIGSDLRDLYDDVETAALPSDLLRLARLIDGKRTPEREDGSAA